jgi:hypothetical protein
MGKIPRQPEHLSAHYARPRPRANSEAQVGGGLAPGVREDPAKLALAPAQFSFVASANLGG